MVRGKQSAFTLIEVLISLALFAGAMLSVALFLAKGIKTNINNDVHATAMRVAQQAVEPLYGALRQGPLVLRDALLSMNDYVPPSLDGPVSANFAVSVTARDGNNADLLSTDPAAWQPPFVVVLGITYDGEHGVLSFPPTTHVLVPEPEA